MEDFEIEKWLAGDLATRGPKLRRRLAAEAMALAGAVEGAADRPDLPSPVVCYELDRHRVVLLGARPFSLGSQGDAQPTLRAEVSRTRHDRLAGGGFEGPSCLVELSHSRTTELLLDLAAASVTSVVGSDTAVDETLLELSHQAVTGAFGRPTRTIVVGRELRRVADADGAILVSRVEECLEMLRRLETTGRINDGLVTVIAISRESFRGASAAVLVHYATRRPWLALLLPSPAPSAQALVTAVGGEHSVYVRSSSGPATEAAFGDSLDGALTLDPPVEVAVLGPIEVRGAAVDAIERRPLLSELIVYLAMHPEGAATTTWQAALWPGRRVPAQTVANRLSEARRLLGMELDGSPRLRLSAERHRLVGVTTDWERFRILADPRRDPTSWRDALELVRGRAFDDLQQGQWTYLEGFTGEIETAIIDCALRYGELCLAAGDPESAAWAGQRAIRANPYDERLHRMLMRAADAAGNRSGVDAVYRNLLLILDIDGDGAASVHPETAALYEQLSGGHHLDSRV